MKTPEERAAKSLNRWNTTDPKLVAIIAEAIREAVEEERAALAVAFHNRALALEDDPELATEVGVEGILWCRDFVLSRGKP